MSIRRDKIIKRIQKLNAAREYIPTHYTEAFRKRFPEYKKDARVNKVLGMQCFDTELIVCWELWIKELKEKQK